MNQYASVDEYIAAQPQALQSKLKQLRRTIKAVVPKAEEVISYCMPAFKQEGIVVWYAATKKHFALYPKTTAVAAFRKELALYDIAKGTIRFPLEKPLPLDLIQEIVRFRVAENKAEATAKQAAKAGKRKVKNPATSTL